MCVCVCNHASAREERKTCAQKLDYRPRCGYKAAVSGLTESQWVGGPGGT